MPPTPSQPDTAAPAAAARAAGLRYVSDESPGIRRVRAGRGFRYVGVNGKPVRNPAELLRIRSLAIPPAWTDVWICPQADGHLQATGRDSRGRKQHRYHRHWRAVRDETKYGRMLLFAEALPHIRERVTRDLAAPGLPRDKVLATVVRLLETTFARVGNEEYARQNRSFGLTTLRSRHAQVNGSTLRFEFRGKSGVRHTVELRDRRLARIVRRCQELPGQELFQYMDEDQTRRPIGSADVNAYLREASGEGLTAKDFRTWAGTLLALRALRESPPFHSRTEAERHLVRALDAVAGQLGNTRAVCRSCYVHPGVLDAYLAGTLGEVFRGTEADEEAALLAFLRGPGEPPAAGTR